MVAPTSSVTKTLGGRDGTYYMYKSGFRQKKPYTLVLPLDHRQSKFTLSDSRFVFFNPGQATDWMVTNGESNSQQAQIDNVTYSKFIGKLKSEQRNPGDGDKPDATKADLGITLGEHRAAREMIIKRSRNLWQLASALARRDFKRAGLVVGVKDIRYRPGSKNISVRYQKPDFPGLWLEASWGWRPMVEDIANALNTIVSPLSPSYVRASHYGVNTWNARDDDIVGSTGVYSYRQLHRDTWDYKYKSSTGATVSVSNHNVALANRLGVLNIPQIWWATTPFSFLIDKYVNIGQLIGSLTDTYGFTLTQVWTVRKIVLEQTGLMVEWRDYGSGPTITDTYTSNGVSITKRRSGSLLGPTLTLRSPSIGSYGEAVSYMALLVQLLRKNS